MILDRLFSKRASLENPSTSLSDPANWLFEAFGAQPTTANVTVSTRTATQITAFWSAVNTIADTIGELPVRLIQAKRDGSFKVIDRHPALDLLRLSPNPMMNAIVYKSTAQAHTLVHGNSYTWIKRDQAGSPGELWPLMPQETKAVIENGQLHFESRLDIGQTKFRPEDILHVPALARNGVDGMSIVAEQREVLGSVVAANRFGARFFGNGARPGGLLTFPGKVRDPEKVRKAVEQAAGGENQNGLVVLSEGADYKQMGIPPEDAQFLQTREFGVDEIARMFRLPSHFLNKMGQATFNNLEQMGTHFAQYTMMPWIIRHEQEYTRKLLTEAEIRRGMRFKLNVAALVRGDIKTRSEVYAKGIQFGWMTRNEVRALEDMNPLEGLDEPLVPMNLSVVGEEPEPMPEPEPPPEPAPDEEPEDEDQGERSYIVMTALVQRLANKEANAMRRIARKHYDAEQLTDEIAAFYRSFAELLVENLAMTPECARQYCEAHGIEFVDADNRDEVILRWTTAGVNELVNQLSEAAI